MINSQNIGVDGLDFGRELVVRGRFEIWGQWGAVGNARAE